MRRVLILSNIINIDKNIIENSFIIGVDKGAYIAALNNIHMDIAIGDFDSIKPLMLDTINFRALYEAKKDTLKKM